MARDVDELFARMGPERLAKVDEEVDEIRRAPLYRIRKALALTQEQITRRLRRAVAGCNL